MFYVHEDFADEVFTLTDIQDEYNYCLRIGQITTRDYPTFEDYYEMSISRHGRYTAVEADEEFFHGWNVHAYRLGDIVTVWYTEDDCSEAFLNDQSGRQTALMMAMFYDDLHRMD
jgi:hypothetical protein